MGVAVRAVRNQERAEGPVEVLVQVGGKEVDHEQLVDETVDEMDGSDSGSDDLHMGGQGDLASRTLVLESKRFYLDVKENQILMTFSTAAVFSQNLMGFIDFYKDLDKVNPDNLRQGELKSEVMYKDDKKYHMDLKENARGRFLKVSETFTRGYSRFQVRSQVFIPAEGMDEFQQNLGELINEYDTGDAEDALAAPQNRHLRVENKNFYFDIKRNAQGRYMTISEVKGNYRNSILIPEIGWENFRDVLDDYVKQKINQRCLAVQHPNRSKYSHLTFLPSLPPTIASLPTFAEGEGGAEGGNPS